MTHVANLVSQLKEEQHSLEMEQVGAAGHASGGLFGLERSMPEPAAAEFDAPRPASFDQRHGFL